MGEDIAIVIVTYNSADVIVSLLDSLPAALAGQPADVIVVDSGSSDATCAILQTRDDCHVIKTANLGYAAAINTGVRAAPKASRLLVLNADVVLGESSVIVLSNRLAGPGIGITVPRVLEADGRLHLSLRREPTALRALGLGRTGLPMLSEYVTSPADYVASATVDWALGAAMMFTRRCFEAVQGWDTSFFLYSEETDFCLRAKDLGFETLYEPSATITHIGGQSGQSDVTHVMQIINRVRLYRRRHGIVSASCYYLLTIASELSWIVRGHAQSRASVRALISPNRRPAVLNCSGSLIPA